MIIVNPFLIQEVLNPLIGMADIEDAIDEFGLINPDNEMEVKKLGTEYLKPAFRNMDIRVQKASKDSLAFYLLFPDKIDFEAIYNSLLIPIDTPKNSRLFFQWLWESFFPNESKDYIKQETVIEKKDANAKLNILYGIYEDYNGPLN